MPYQSTFKFIGFDDFTFDYLISARYDAEAKFRIKDFLDSVGNHFFKKGDRFISHRELVDLIESRKTLFNISFEGNKNSQLKTIIDICFEATQKNSYFDFEKLNSKLDEFSSDDEQFDAVHNLMEKTKEFIDKNRRLPTKLEFGVQVLKIKEIDFNNPKFNKIHEAILSSLRPEEEVQAIFQRNDKLILDAMANSQGTSPPSPSSSSSNTPSSQSPSNTLLSTSGTPSDQNPILINQKNIGECAFLSAFQSISKSLLGRQKLRESVIEKENEYQVKVFNAKGEPEFVMVTKSELRDFSVGNQNKETYPALLTRRDGRTFWKNITQNEYTNLLSDKEYSKVEADFNRQPTLEPLKEASCSTSINGICSLMDILRLAYIKSSIFRQSKELTIDADLGTLLRKFNDGNFPASIMKALTGQEVGRVSKDNYWDFDSSQPSLFSPGLRLPFKWGFNDWINEFKNNPHKYAINTFTSKQNIDIPQEFRNKGIVSGHAYTVSFKDEKAILRNPWNSEDTVISIQEFHNIFDCMEYSIIQ